MSEKFYMQALQYALEEILNEYKAQQNEDEFNMWFNKIQYVDETTDTVTVSVASRFLQQFMDKKGYFKVVEDKIKNITAQDNLKLVCLVQDDNKPSTPNLSIDLKKETINFSELEEKDQDPEPVIEKSTKKKHPQLDEKFTFESFVPGENCNYAYNMCLAAAKNPGSKYNPILIYGASGLGKTHLMQAIGNYIYQNSSEKLKICYVSAETFGNEFTSSIKVNNPNAFKNKYRNLDVLLLDDIHFFQNKNGMQEELFYTFDALNSKKAQMIFTCDRPLKEIKNMASRLVSRIQNGYCIDISVPNYETRCAILQRKLEEMNKYLEPEIINYIAENIETNVRDLESALKQVIAYAEITEEQPDLNSVKNQLRDIISKTPAQNISIETIQKVIANEYQISVSDLKGKKRDSKYAVPRHIAAYISREITEYSLTEIGNEFGGRDHTTIMNSYEKIADKIKIDQNFNSRIQLLIKQIKEYKNN